MYYLLGGFDVLSVLASLLLSTLLMQQYTASVEENQTWSDLRTSIEALGQVATQANGPGNDVFENKDVAGESTRLKAFVAEYQRRQEAAERAIDLAVPDVALATEMHKQLEAARVEFDEMVSEANTIFAAFSRNDPDEAGKHMAQMDRSLAATGEALAAMSASARGLQANALDAQLKSAATMQKYEWLLVGFVALMVIFIIQYGGKLAQVFRQAQDTIEQQNKDMRSVLDEVAQGLVTVDLSGALGRERSAAVDRLLGAPQTGEDACQWMRRVAPEIGVAFELGLEQLREGFLPAELLLDQMPSRVSRGDHHFSLEYRPVMRDATLTGFLLVVTDITATIQQARAERDQKELLALVQRWTIDPNGLRETFGELDRLVRLIGQHELGSADLKRAVHTVKGTGSLLGLTGLPTLCHELEDRMAEDERELTDDERRQMAAVWEELRERARCLVGESTAGEITISEGELRNAIEQVVKGNDRARLALQMASWRHEPAARRLARLGEQASTLALRLGKDIEVRTEAEAVRLPSAEWSELWTALSHAIRNAVDHGIEAPSERVAAGKDQRGHLVFRASSQAGRLAIEIVDDGAGIDWERVRARARALGLPHQTQEDLTSALFADGFSTREDVTDISGRGVGMSAIRAAAGRIGGELSVVSERGRGTVLRVAVPHAPVALAA